MKKITCSLLCLFCFLFGLFLGEYNVSQRAKKESIKVLLSAEEKGLISFNTNEIFGLVK